MGRALGRGLPTWQLGADETTPMARFSCRSGCVRFWHNADIPVAPIHVNVAGERRCHATGTRASQFTAKQSCQPLRSARCVLDRRFEALCVEGRHTLDPPQTLGGVPDGEREHRLRIRGIDDVDEVVVALRVVDRLYLDAQFVELCLGLPDSLRLLTCVLRVQISKQHIFHNHLHVMWIVLREDHAIIRLLATSTHAVSHYNPRITTPWANRHQGASIMGIRRRGGTIFWAGLAVSMTAGPSGQTISPHPSSREGHHSTVGWSSISSYRI